MPHTLFISDLHLDATQADMAEKFINFLARDAMKADALYILGDLFETWIGDDDDNTFNRGIIKALRMASAEIPIYVMHGNRDFLLGERFANASGCKLIDDPHCIDLYGRKTIVTHGDLLCLDDVKYQAFRRRSRSKLSKTLFLSLPVKIRQHIANKVRKGSKKHIANVTAATMNVTPGEDLKIMHKYQATLLIHGHTHQPAIHQLDNDYVRVTLAAWHTQGNALVYACDQNKHVTYELIYF
ncbi:MAG: UDP-2,3-diacylglucosamine diphosphatase [Pseudomonadota bacterium]